ncbi:MAG: hypothetical protein O7J95_07165, partial [Planctomycetota bacterium]|nr:hypothetical protein [Planctomycetota bacterium]
MSRGFTPRSAGAVKNPLLRLLVLAMPLLPGTAAGQDPFAAHVRPTDPLPPEAERQTFRLPPGFEIQLVASEPDIMKPLNMAFDSRGRLWVTDTCEYPYAAPRDRKGRDTIKILEDLDRDGRADRITTFADGLNIPMGLQPYGNGVIAWSIPDISYFEDTDGDGTADRRTKLYGPLGFERDTHGMNNSFRRVFDGWIYACHGFNNLTTVSGADGHNVEMQSGNTYRMRPDGSRIEQFTWGQVNPFGMAFDPLGNIFTADCHSKPVYRLLRGGYYPSFGKPHDGLGFVPQVMEHQHGSTAISGVALYASGNFPAEFHGDIFIGNVMTSRVNRDSLVFHGATVEARKKPDFVITTDPWFRPVDLRIGPDGALYIADFYNRIIGHYEVPLDHPGRDRFRGRIWRVTYKGRGEPTIDLATAGIPQLIAALDHPIPTYRALALNELVDRLGPNALDPLVSALTRSRSSRVRSQALWAVERLGAMRDDLLALATGDPAREVRVHAMRLLSERPRLTPPLRLLALVGLRDRDAMVNLAAADALGRHPHHGNLRPLLDLLRRTPPEDTHLGHTARMALRNHLRDPDAFGELEGAAALDETDTRAVADVCLGLSSRRAASHLLAASRRLRLTPGETRRYLQHVARHLDPEDVGRFVALARERLAGDVDVQVEFLRGIHADLEKRGVAAGEAVSSWGSDLTGELLESLGEDSPAWASTPLPGRRRENPWALEKRRSADGDRDSLFLSSRPLNERFTGVLRSAPFDVPRELRFYLAGHDGFPDKSLQGKNVVRLVAADGEVLASAAPPRNDTAQLVTWNLHDSQGRQAHLEVVDGDNAGSYAWIALGRLDPPVVPWPRLAPSVVSRRQLAAATLIGDLGLRHLASHLVKLVDSTLVDAASREAAARALVRLDPDPLLAALIPVIGDPAVPESSKAGVVRLFTKRDPEAIRRGLQEAMRLASGRLQQRIARDLTGDTRGAETLLALIRERHASPRL